MTRHQMLALFLVALLASSTFAQLSLLAPALPSPSDVIKVIDMLTRKDTDTKMDVRFGKTTNYGKLLIARTHVDVTMKRTSRNWRGPVIVDMTVPSDVSYSVDLSSLRPENIRLDAKKRRLLVAMPMPTVEDVTPLLPDLSINSNFNRARFKFLDSDTSRELQNVMLREDYQAKVRQEAMKHLPRVREEGKAVLAAFLQRLLAASFPKFVVVVE